MLGLSLWLSPSANVPGSALILLLKSDQPTDALTVFWGGGCVLVRVCVYVWTHARVCRRGPHRTLFCFPLKAEEQECLPPSCPQQWWQGKRGGAHHSPSLTSTHLLHPDTVGEGICVCVCILVGKRVTQWGSPLPSPTLAYHAYLTLQMQSCLLSYSEARCLNLPPWPLPQFSGTMECNSSTRGSLNAL